MKFKLSKEETVELGMELYLKGWNCGEATSTAFIRALGYDTDLFPRAGTSLGSGFGGEHRYQCGALASAVLASGAAFGRDDPDGDRSPSNNLATQFIKDFEKKFGTFNCYELVGLEPGSGDSWNIPYKAQNKREEKCVHFVRYSIEHWYDLAQEFIKEQESVT